MTTKPAPYLLDCDEDARLAAKSKMLLKLLCLSTESMHKCISPMDLFPYQYSTMHSSNHIETLTIETKSGLFATTSGMYTTKSYALHS